MRMTGFPGGLPLNRMCPLIVPASRLPRSQLPGHQGHDQHSDGQEKSRSGHGPPVMSQFDFTFDGKAGITWLGYQYLR